VLLAASIALLVGTLAGWVGGRTDAVLMRLVDSFLSIPRPLLLIAVLALWGAMSPPGLVLLLGLTGWFGVSRLVRAEVVLHRRAEHVQAARALGARPLRLVVRHVLPAVLPSILVAMTLGVGEVIALEAGLSYLGVGLRPPAASWGTIIADASTVGPSVWWLILFPGLAIVTTTLAANTLADALRDAIDPRQVH